MATEGAGAQPARSLMKDFHRLMKNIASMSGGQARVDGWDEETAESEHVFTVAVVPDSGPYKDGEFEFEITTYIAAYPEECPSVKCMTDIYHPNINTEGTICLNILDEGEWTYRMNLEDVVQGILFLMHNPNLEDPLSSIVDRDSDKKTFEDDVRRSLDGETVGEFDFTWNRVMRGEDGEIIREDGPEEAVCAEDPPQQDAAGDQLATTDAAAEDKTTEQRQNKEAKDELVKKIARDGPLEIHEDKEAL